MPPLSEISQTLPLFRFDSFPKEFPLLVCSREETHSELLTSSNLSERQEVLVICSLKFSYLRARSPSTTDESYTIITIYIHVGSKVSTSTTFTVDIIHCLHLLKLHCTFKMLLYIHFYNLYTSDGQILFTVT